MIIVQVCDIFKQALAFPINSRGLFKAIFRAFLPFLTSVASLLRNALLFQNGVSEELLQVGILSLICSELALVPQVELL